MTQPARDGWAWLDRRARLERDYLDAVLEQRYKKLGLKPKQDRKAAERELEQARLFPKL